MKRYEKYKPTGIQWLPEIPEHWNISKIKSHFRLRATKVSDNEYSALSVSKNGITPQLDSAVKTDNGDNRKLVKSGDFVVNSRSDRKGSCGISSLDGSVSLINIVLEPIDGFGLFYHHLFRSNNYIEEFYRNGRGIVSDLWTTRWNEMSSIEIPFPPIDEQKHIAAYLDKRITLIENKANKKYVKLQTINRDFSEIDIQLKKLDNLIFRKINSIEEDELSFELTSFIKYVASQKEIDFTCTDIVLKANIPMSPKRFGRLLNNSIELLESEGVHITKCRTADSRLYHATFIEPSQNEDE